MLMLSQIDKIYIIKKERYMVEKWGHNQMDRKEPHEL